MVLKLIELENPPFPVPSNLLFQLARGGNQSSMWISESLAGRDTARTRQKAATFIEPGAPGGVYGPAGTSSADVMVVLVMNRSARLEHVGDAAVATGAKDNTVSKTRQFITSIVTISVLL